MRFLTKMLPLLAGGAMLAAVMPAVAHDAVVPVQWRNERGYYVDPPPRWVPARPHHRHYRRPPPPVYYAPPPRPRYYAPQPAPGLYFRF